ncbi:MAG: hypothetical protein R3B54_03385 [Bdellovibrionota bacterium]
MFHKVFAFFIAAVVSVSGIAGDIPGGQVRDAEGLMPNTFEVMLSPEVVFQNGGIYLNSELRYQASEDIGVGFGFGSGEMGYNFGGYGVWYIIPDLQSQPAVSILGGMYFNSLNVENFFVLRFSPTVSKRFVMGWGNLTPYWAMQFSPAFSFGASPNIFSIRTAMGSQINVHALGGLRLWLEFGLGIVNGINEFALGISYPFSGLNG